MKTMLCFVLLAAAMTLGACQTADNAAARNDGGARGTELGNTGVRTSGSLELGGSAVAR